MDQSFKEQIDELQRQAKTADKLDRERAEQFRSLIRHPGWDTYQKLLSSRIQSFSDVVLRPSGSMDGAIALEWVKGAMSGLLMAQDLPSVTIKAIEATVPATEDDNDA